MLESATGTGHLRIVLIDDNPDDRALVERELRLRIAAPEVTHVGDAGALTAVLDAGGFDVAITDYRLRWTVGTDVLRAIKERYPQVPVIMFTGSGNEEVAVEAMKDGLDDYITKTPKHYPRVPYAVLGCFERASNRARLQQSLARETLAKARLEIALQSAGMGTWQYDLDTRQLSFSDEIGPMCGRERGFVHASAEEALAQIHPDDVARVHAAWRHALDDGAASTIECRVPGVDGTTRWLAVSAKIVDHDASGKRLVIGTARDVTADVTAKEALHKQQEDLQTILDVLPVGVAISHDLQARDIAVSRYFSGLLGLDATAAGQAPLAPDHGRRYRYFRDGTFLDPEDWPMRVAAREGATVRGDELEVRFDDGRTLAILVNAAPLPDGHGGVRGAVAAVMDISALKDVQRKLEEANRQKSEFLSVLAHELRNPMAAIGYSVEMLRRVASPETIGKAREVIGRQTAHMGRLLDDLLDLSRITYNRIELDVKPLDIRRVLELAYDSTRAAMDALGHEVRFELPAAPLMVLGDEVRLTQVMSNLLNNAAKFTPPGGAITVRAYGTPERVELAIIDNGVGIAPDQLEQVFDMFSQGESKVSGGTPGLGIGLAVVRKLVELHGGSVRAASEGPGQGTTLRVDLPRIDAVQAHPSRPTLPAHPGQGRLLVADDNTDAADLLAALLEAEGHAVRVAYDGEAAIRLAGEWRPDLLLLDIGMPLANGLEVARWVRAQEWGRTAALVAVTGWGQDADREETAKAGFDVHLVKPVSPEEILRTIGRYLPGQRTAR